MSPSRRASPPADPRLPPPAPLLTGRRVLIRFPVSADAPEFTRLRRVSRRFHAPWEPRPPRGAPAWDDFSHFLATADAPDRKRFLICRRSDGAIVGYVGLSQIFLGPLRSACMGYWVALPFAGHGYMTEGVRLVLRYAFTTLKLHRVEANMQPSNASSRALARRCGLRREGFSPRYLKIAGRWRDHERWALTVEDWRSRPATRRRHAPSPRPTARTPARSPAST